jgi:hypothetical protein
VTQDQAEALIENAINYFLMDPAYKESREKIRANPEKAEDIIRQLQGDMAIDLNQLCLDNPELLDQIVDEIQQGSLDGDEEMSESELQNLLSGGDGNITLFSWNVKSDNPAADHC